MKISFKLAVGLLIVIALFTAPAIATAQAGQRTGVGGWYKFGVPVPSLTGPAPKLANGKPSLEGMWSQTRRADVTNPNVQAGFVPDLPFTPWGQRQWDNYDPVKDGDYAGSCLPFGWSRTVFGPHPMYLVHTDDKLVILSEQNSWFHIVYTDGRPHDPSLPPSWWGDSVGRWDGDTLIVETKNFNGYAKVDTIGHPLSSQTTITQTFKRVNFGTIEHTFTVTDPKTYTRPWTVKNTWPIEPFNTKMLEYSCEEGNLDALIEGAITPWHPPTGEDAP